MSITSLRLPSNLTNELASVEIINIIDQLPVNPNHSWAQLAGVRSPDELTTIAIHHDAWPKKNRATKSDVDFAAEIAEDHIEYTGNESKGDAGFPYHLWVRNGVVYQCNDLTVRTYGVRGNNGYTVHICVSGDYKNYDVLTDADRNALYVAILAVKKALPECTIIKGHNEFISTACPGFSMDQVRKDILTIENRIQYEQSAEAKLDNANKVINDFLFVANMAQGKNPDGTEADPSNVGWALNTLMELRVFMNDHGFK